MTETVNARFANGVFTPLHPVDVPEGALVILNIETDHSQETPTTNQPDSFVPHSGKFLPGMEDPQKIKQLLMDEDAGHHARSSEQGGFI